VFGCGIADFLTNERGVTQGHEGHVKGRDVSGWLVETLKLKVRLGMTAGGHAQEIEKAKVTASGPGGAGDRSATAEGCIAVGDPSGEELTVIAGIEDGEVPGDPVVPGLSADAIKGVVAGDYGIGDYGIDVWGELVTVKP